jgi:hypothetical protein
MSEILKEVLWQQRRAVKLQAASQPRTPRRARLLPLTSQSPQENQESRRKN